jgi:hypothetical protein
MWYCYHMSLYRKLIGYFFIIFSCFASIWLIGAMVSILPIPLLVFGDTVGIKVLATCSVGGWCFAAICTKDDLD